MKTATFWALLVWGAVTTQAVPEHFEVFLEEADSSFIVDIDAPFRIWTDALGWHLQAGATLLDNSILKQLDIVGGPLGIGIEYYALPHGTNKRGLQSTIPQGGTFGTPHEAWAAFKADYTARGILRQVPSTGNTLALLGLGLLPLALARHRAKNRLA